MTYFGNQCYASAWSVGQKIDVGTEKVSIRFTAQKNGTVEEVNIEVEVTYATHQIDVEVGIQGDAGGDPDGTFLGSQVKSYNANRTGTETVTLTPSVTLVAGTTYHIVVSPTGANQPDATNYVEISYCEPLLNLIPVSDVQESDINQNYLFYNGVAWADLDKAPLYSLKFDDATYEGYPYGGITYYGDAIYGNKYTGEIFTPSSEKMAAILETYVKKSGNPADSLYIKVEYSDDDGVTWTTAISTQVFAEAADIAAAYGWVSKQLSSLRFHPDYKYRIIFSSPNSVIAAAYSLVGGRYDGSHVIWGPLTWRGATNGYLIDESQPTGDVRADLTFRFTEMTLTPYRTATLLMHCGL